MANNRLKDLNDYVLEHIGYKPLSNGIKPVHIANGLFRYVLGEYYKLDALNKWAKRFKDGKEIHSAQEIKEEFREILDDDMTEEDINELRTYIGMLLNADKGAQPSVKYSALTMSSKTQVGGIVQNEFEMPVFLYRILNTPLENEISPVIRTIKDSLSDENDEISRFLSLLTTKVESRSINDLDSLSELSGVELKIRESYDRLLLNSMGENKLLLLERLIIFGCFSILYHLGSKILDYDDSISTHNPIVLDANIGDETIQRASQESLLLTRINIESLYEKILENFFEKEGVIKTKEDVINAINEFSIEVKEENVNPHKELEELFSGYYQQTGRLLESFARAIRIIMYTRVLKTDDPPKTYVSLAKRINLVFGRSKKRFISDPNILEILILAALNKGENLTLSEFGQRIWDEFGIIIGANPEKDVDILRKYNISENTPGDLHNSLSINSDGISEMYISMGYAKKYADGVIIFGL
ncbi:MULTISPECIES: hypothetical protein [Bhargavaea]|uniref:Uncharacterized protein n=1 Tax=Bhargavaea changchunensis TaxID=2134037 RepID=A0ABW2NLS5_9BACL|nr:hypothetical protein [Bhargavaea sp. CC-171006]